MLNCNRSLIKNIRQVFSVCLLVYVAYLGTSLVVF